jgi:hypothetical protein
MDKRAFTSYDTSYLPGLGNLAQETLKRPQAKTLVLLPLVSVNPLTGSYLCAFTSKLFYAPNYTSTLTVSVLPAVCQKHESIHHCLLPSSGR